MEFGEGKKVRLWGPSLASRGGMSYPLAPYMQFSRLTPRFSRNHCTKSPVTITRLQVLAANPPGCGTGSKLPSLRMEVASAMSLRPVPSPCRDTGAYGVLVGVMHSTGWSEAVLSVNLRGVPCPGERKVASAGFI